MSGYRLFTLLCILLATLGATQSPAATSVWKAEKAGHTLYLGGTFHLLRPSDLPLPREYAVAYAASDQIVLEADVSAIATPAVQEQMITLMSAAPGQHMQELLSPATYRQLAEAFAARGLDIQRVSRFKVGMAILTLQTAEIMRLGHSLEGVDAIYYKRARRDGKPIVFLETVAQQIGYLASMGEGWEEDFVKYALRDLERTADLMNTVSTAWRNGDRRKLRQLFVAEIRQDYPQAYNELLVQRNRNWLPRIEALAESSETAFVLVGVGHMVGPDGLLRQLRKRGFRLTQLQAQDTATADPR